MRIAALALLAGAAIVLTGCAPSAPHPTRSPVASATPVFASDADALAAAEKAYAAYLAVSDQVGADGGGDPDRLRAYVTDSRMEVERQGADLFVNNDVRTSGKTEFSNSTLEGVATRGRDVVITFYACWDVSAVHVIDASGNDVTPATRKSRQTLEITMTTIGGALPLLLDGDEAWSGPSVCS